jgi:hypothetical protein
LHDFNQTYYLKVATVLLNSLRQTFESGTDKIDFFVSITVTDSVGSTLTLPHKGIRLDFEDGNSSDDSGSVSNFRNRNNSPAIDTDVANKFLSNFLDSVTLDEDQVKEVYGDIGLTQSKDDQVSPDGKLKFEFVRDLYWPDTLTEVKEFMPSYVYVDPEVAALEALKQQIQAE